MITTINFEVSVAHQLFDLLKDWQEVYQLTGTGRFEVCTIAWLLGLL